tara:strand:+ start:71 stop:490 length:420 start_codon:yes stop_codon:yes gene_type:complete
MAHFAKLDENNIVTTVNVVHSNELLVDGVENEQKGIDFLNTFFNTSNNWKQTSYNTVGGVHKLGGTPFRKNYASIGDIYDATRDAFMKPQPPYPSWPFNETTCLWEPPVPMPTKTVEQSGDNKHYVWNENNTSWDYEEI